MILLLENKDIRYKNTSTSIYEPSIDIILGDEKCNNLLDNFLKDTAIFNSYDIIIIHESIYYPEKRDELLEKIESYCLNAKKKLIKFSGGNTQPYLRKNILEISAKSMYLNLQVFSEKYVSNEADVLMLAYGKDWRLNILLNTLEGIDILLADSEEESIDFDEFEDDFDLLKIKNILGESEYGSLFHKLDIDDEVTLKQIKQFANNLRVFIQGKANE